MQLQRDTHKGRFIKTSNKCSAVAEMGDWATVATIDMGRKEG